MYLLKKAKRYLKHIALKKENVETAVLYGSLLKNRTAFITGGTSGIGRAIAESFVRNGASVAITGRDQIRVDSTVQELRENFEGVSVTGLVLDNSSGDPEVFLHALETAEAALEHPIDILVNNAGIIAGGKIPITDVEGYNLTLNTNLRGSYFLSQHFSKRLVACKLTGNILNVCSSSSLRPAISPYTISKWGMRGLTLGMAKQLAPYGITVNGIAPGPTATPMLLSDGDDNIANENVPFGRFATAEEIANMAVVLVSDLSRMVVGDVLYMTGGSGVVTFDDMDYSFDF